MKLGLPIRYKMLIVISVVLLAAMGSYLYMATKLFNEDKLTYIFDLNSFMVASLAEQTRSELTVLKKEMTIFMREVIELPLTDQQRKTKAASFLAGDSDILRIEVFGQKQGHTISDSCTWNLSE